MARRAWTEAEIALLTYAVAKQARPLSNAAWRRSVSLRRVSCVKSCRVSARERVEVAQSAGGPLRAERLYLLYCHSTKLSNFDLLYCHFTYFSK